MQTAIKRRRISGLTAVSNWLRERIGNRTAVAELTNVGEQDLQRIAADVGTSPGELRALAAKWPESAHLLSRRLAALNLDAAEIARTQPSVSNELKRLCSLCESKKRCALELDENPASSEWRKYCPNTATLDALREQQARSGGGKGI